jgi:GR25 family glycosyltransferase involved in LPS biosynthesis
MRVFVITSELTAIRRRHVGQLLAEIEKEIPDIRVEFVTECEPGDTEGIDSLVKLDRLEEPLAKYNRFTKTLHVRNVSNARKHQLALSRAAACEGPSLIVEDDIVSGENFVSVLKKCLEDKSWRVLMLGLPGRAAGIHPLRDIHETLPSCDSYLVTPDAAKTLADAFFPLRFVTNVHLSLLFDVTGTAPHMCAPNVFVDGSKYGVYASTLSPNNPLFLNKAYMEARNVLSDDARWAENGHKVLDALLASPFKNHPDFVYLRALYERRRSGARAAELVFSTALKLYDDNNCIVNNESEFLRQYIALYGDIQ